MGFLKRSWRAFRKGRVWILGLVGLLLLSFWAVSGSETFQSCRAGEKSDFQDAVFHKTATPAPPEQADTSVEACLDYFLEENEPGIAALSVIFTTLFTGVLAISTIGLWNSTKSLHEETKRNEIHIGDRMFETRGNESRYRKDDRQDLVACRDRMGAHRPLRQAPSWPTLRRSR